MTYRFDGDELFSLAGWLRRLSAETEEIQHQILAALSRVGRWSTASVDLKDMAYSCMDRADDLAARALALSDLNPAIWTAAHDRSNTLETAWRDAARFSGSDNDPSLDLKLRTVADIEQAFLASLAGLSPAQVAAITAGLPIEVGRRLAWREPNSVASRDGLPLSWRAIATRHLMRSESARLRAALDASPGSEGMGARLELLDGWLESDRTFIWFDPAGDGQLVEIVGDLAAAEAIGVFVPGISSDLATFESVASHARGLVSTGSTMGRDVAVVAWLGYDAPAGIGLNLESVWSKHARLGAPRLVDFVDGLSAQRPDVPITVVAHSYGSVVAGWAATFDHLTVDRLVIIGSPNVAAKHAGALNLPSPNAVFVGEAPLDPIVAIGDFTDGWRDDWSRLGHGSDPGRCDWGATVFDVQNVGLIDAHVTYSSGKSAETIINVMIGEVDHIADRCDG